MRPDQRFLRPLFPPPPANERLSGAPRWRPALLAGGVALLLLLSSGLAAAPPAKPTLDLPWREAGWSEREAAAHLLDRLAYGARPGEIDRVVEIGLEEWVERQLAADLDDSEIDRRLRGLNSLGLSAREASERYPDPGMVLRMANRAGVADREDLERMRSGEGEGNRTERSAMRRDMMAFAEDRGFRPQRELLGEAMVAKLGRAVYSENQLREVLTDFWFNHFNVSLTDNDARVFVPSYERDAIAPHVLGDFRAMLEATAKHPAMLLYLDNARSVADEGTRTTFDREQFENRRRGRRGGFGAGSRGAGGFGNRGRDRGFGTGLDEDTRQRLEERRPQGLNENYARELMELHTLGVDGGYTQDDVIEVARAFTGWATYPPGPARREIEQRIAQARRIPNAGFVFEDDFLFRADVHDAEAKTVLGRRLAAGRGMEDGLEVLDLLATHPSTAQHLARKLAIRFVADEPPSALVESLADTFLAHDGAIEPMMRTLVASPEFWDRGVRRAKIKTPLELTASALRATGAEVDDPRALIEWLRRLGQMPFAYQAPTGYPDVAESWVNTGALLERMNFGLQLATGRVAGIDLDLAALDGGREPESLDAALVTYVPILLPERDPGETVERLTPVIRDPELANKIADAAPAEPADDGFFAGFFGDGPPGRRGPPGFGEGADRRRRGPFGRDPAPAPQNLDNSPLAHVVGVILGSPEFQRR